MLLILLLITDSWNECNYTVTVYCTINPKTYIIKENRTNIIKDNRRNLGLQ